MLKPLVGVENDGPGDAAVVRPILSSRRGLAISCGMNPHFGELDPYHMATSSIDEAIRNCVAVGADPDRIAILDNFCWGYTDRPETLGTLVRAALACHDLSKVYHTPFISGKDSLNNEFSYTDADGQRQTISIPSTLLISAMGQVDDTRKCVSMDLKQSGNAIYLVGKTGAHLGGSHFALIRNLDGGNVPTVDAQYNRETFKRMHQAISAGQIRACHDLSEGGLAVAISEMAFAGGFGVHLDIKGLCDRDEIDSIVALFSESNGRFVCEVEPDQKDAFENSLQDRCCLIGTVTDGSDVKIVKAESELIRGELGTFKSAWQKPLDWK